MRAQTVLIASLFLVACSPSATVSAPPEAPGATPVVVAEPVADAPFAANGGAVTARAPRVVLVGTALRVDGAPAGDVATLKGPTLRQALAASSQKTHGGTVEVLVPPATRIGVLREILIHATVSGHPYARILVRAAGDVGPNSTELRALDIDSSPDLADTPREPDRPAAFAPEDGPHLVSKFAGGRERTGRRTLHVAAMEGNVLIAWKDGAKVLAAADVSRPSDAAPGGLPELAAKVTEQWASLGQHRDAGDLDADRAVIHIGDSEDVATLVAILDALATTTRPRGSERVPAFRVALGPSPKPAPSPSDTPAPRSTTAHDPIGAVLHGAEGTFRRCYMEGLRTQPALAGSVRITFAIEASGRVSNAVASQTDLPDPAVVTCLVGAVSALTFPPQPAKVSMTLPLRFKAPD
jgi:hypothetical protein